MNTPVTQTKSTIFTVTDIRKTFDSFQADLRMIARRTEKWTQEFTENICYDILQFAEGHFLKSADLILYDIQNKEIQVTRYTVSTDGKSISGDRPKDEDWPNLPDSRLKIIVSNTTSWWSETEEGREKFKKERGFKLNWPISQHDGTYSHLTQQKGQTYANQGYELSKINFK